MTVTMTLLPLLLATTTLITASPTPKPITLPLHHLTQTRPPPTTRLGIPYRPDILATLEAHATTHAHLRRRDLSDLGPIAEGTGTVAPSEYQVIYIVDTLMDGLPYSLVLDTGSADTWVSKSGFECVDSEGAPLTMAYCPMGPDFMPGFPGGQIDDVHFSITYGYEGGPFIYGEMGYTDITIADVHVPKQQIALATRGLFPGDGESNGIMGLGLPYLTQSFQDGFPVDNVNNLIAYDPIVQTITTEVGLEPIFALALSRNESESFVSFGGVPDVEVEDEYAVAPIVPLNSGDYLFYEFLPTSWSWTNATTTARNPAPPLVLVDSGSTLNLLPIADAFSINASFDPPAEWTGGLEFFVKCDAIPPTFDIVIGGKTISTDPASMILPKATAEDVEGNVYCMSGIGIAPESSYILGDTFMQGLVSVFDVSEKMEMRFAKRK